MFGGTPSNLAISVMKTVDAEVIAGMNLPMLVKLARVRGDMELKPAVTLAAEAGRKYINVASESLGG
jgi:PTS system mannose-specific IIA component